jgi:hypothetical protein
MKKVEQYKTDLQVLQNWDEYLMKHSGLPGRRANLELLYAVIETGTEELFNRYAKEFDASIAPVNTPGVFLTSCGVAGFGKLIRSGQIAYFNSLRKFSSDTRWRVREAVAIGLQVVGSNDMDLLLHEMAVWCQGNLLEKRAVVAALCEPVLLTQKGNAQKVLKILDQITNSILNETDRRNDDFKTLRKTLGYGWSVVVVAYPEPGKALMEKWLLCDDKDILWIMKENLRKDRLSRMDARWTQKWKLDMTIS